MNVTPGPEASINHRQSPSITHRQSVLTIISQQGELNHDTPKLVPDNDAADPRQHPGPFRRGQLAPKTGRDAGLATSPPPYTYT
jgi:hypothetical protein